MSCRQGNIKKVKNQMPSSTNPSEPHIANVLSLNFEAYNRDAKQATLLVEEEWAKSNTAGQLTTKTSLANKVKRAFPQAILKASLLTASLAPLPLFTGFQATARFPLVARSKMNVNFDWMAKPFGCGAIDLPCGGSTSQFVPPRFMIGAPLSAMPAVALPMLLPNSARPFLFCL